MNAAERGSTISNCYSSLLGPFFLRFPIIKGIFIFIKKLVLVIPEFLMMVSSFKGSQIGQYVKLCHWFAWASRELRSFDSELWKFEWCLSWKVVLVYGMLCLWGEKNYEFDVSIFLLAAQLIVNGDLLLTCSISCKVLFLPLVQIPDISAEPLWCLEIFSFFKAIVSLDMSLDSPFIFILWPSHYFPMVQPPIGWFMIINTLVFCNLLSFLTQLWSIIWVVASEYLL